MRDIRRVKYRTNTLDGRKVMLQVVSPFFSDLYGVCVIGYNAESLIRQLSDKLQRDFGFTGTINETDKDDAENVGSNNSKTALSVENKTHDTIGRYRSLGAFSD